MEASQVPTPDHCSPGTEPPPGVPYIPTAPTHLLRTLGTSSAWGQEPPRTPTCAPRETPSILFAPNSISGLSPDPPPPQQDSPLPGDAVGPQAAAPAGITGEGPTVLAQGARGQPRGWASAESRGVSRATLPPGGEGKAGAEEWLRFRGAAGRKDVTAAA